MSNRALKSESAAHLVDKEQISEQVKCGLLEACLERTAAGSNRKSDAALRVIEAMRTNAVYLEHYDELIEALVDRLGEDYFDKLLAVFQSVCPLYALRVVRAFIGLLRTV